MMAGRIPARYPSQQCDRSSEVQPFNFQRLEMSKCKAYTHLTRNQENSHPCRDTPTLRLFQFATRKTSSHFKATNKIQETRYSLSGQHQSPISPERFRNGTSENVAIRAEDRFSACEQLFDSAPSEKKPKSAGIQEIPHFKIENRSRSRD